MLERVRARDGQLVVKWNGRLLSSVHFPQKEATSWVQSAIQNVGEVQSYFVLGAGSGYHLKELTKRCPDKKIFCIERNKDLIAFCDEIHGLELARVTFICPTEAHDILKNGKVVKALQTTYAILTHLPSIQNEEMHYGDLAELLRGRTFLAFKKLLEVREDVRHSLDLKSPCAVSELISIKFLESHIKQDSISEFSTRIKLLRELVK